MDDKIYYQIQFLRLLFLFVGRCSETEWTNSGSFRLNNRKHRINYAGCVFNKQNRHAPKTEFYPLTFHHAKQSID